MNQPIRKAKAPINQQRPPATDNSTYYHRNQAVFVPEGYLAIGRIITAHSLRGEVRVELHTDFPERFAPGTPILIGTALISTVVEEARPHKNFLLVKFAGIDDRSQAETLRDQWLFVKEADAVALEADTYWVHEIIGLRVETEEGEFLGTVTDVIFTGANEVYVVERVLDETVSAEEVNADKAGEKKAKLEKKSKELLLPAIAEVVRAVDIAQKRMVVHLLPGLDG
jgi:16S rRNA processing protein RimM